MNDYDNYRSKDVPDSKKVFSPIVMISTIDILSYVKTILHGLNG